MDSQMDRWIDGWIDSSQLFGSRKLQYSTVVGYIHELHKCMKLGSLCPSSSTQTCQVLTCLTSSIVLHQLPMMGYNWVGGWSQLASQLAPRSLQYFLNGCSFFYLFNCRLKPQGGSIWPQVRALDKGSQTRGPRQGVLDKGPQTRCKRITIPQ